MKYLSVCSGIEAATQAWHPLGWTPVAFSEIEKFPSAVLAHHYPDVPNRGDMTKFKEWPDATIDLLAGGTPCQSFSVAGLRKGLDDPRGNLALTYLAIAELYRPEWLVWENVPGVLSADRGRAFGAIIGGMVELGYCPAWRVLDAQYVRTCRFGRAVPQRRRRVFVVAHLGDWRRAAAVLFDSESLRGNSPPRREAGKETTYDASPCIGASGRGFDSAGESRGQDPVVATGVTIHGTDKTKRVMSFADVAGSLRARPPGMQENSSTTAVAHTLRGEGFDASEDGTGRWTPIVPAAVAFAQNQRDEVRTMDAAGALAAEPGAKQQTYVALQSKASASQSMNPSNVAPALDVAKSGGMAVAVDEYNLSESDVAPTMSGMDAGNRKPATRTGMAVRRLTPVECERLQGFPDDFTRIPWRGKGADKCPDGPRYKALGNSMAVNCMEWIGERIQKVSGIKGNFK